MESDFDTNYSKIIDFDNLWKYKKDGITIKSFSTEASPFLRAYIPFLKNFPKCYNCHNLNEKHLGLLIFEYPFSDTQKTCYLLRNSVFFIP